jgi:dipeptidyl aminopeptidase/acylaminoacyl peptidase
MNGSAMAMPFDPDRLEQTGPVFKVDERVRAEGLSVSREGTIIHVGERIGVLANSRPVVPVVLRQAGPSMDITVGPEVFPPAIYRDAVVNPDGNSAAIVVQERSESSLLPETDIWILDFESGTRRVLTRGGRSDFPAWSTTGDSLYYVETAEDDRIMVTAASGRGGENLVYETSAPAAWDLAFSPDGRWAAYAMGIPPTMDTQTSLRLWRVNADRTLGTMDDPNKFRLETPNGNPRQFDFSPGGRYLAYEDQGAIFVQSLEDLESTPYQIFENSMSLPRWSPDGSKLYAIGPDGSGVSVAVQMEPVFRTVGAPRDEINWFVLAGALFDVFPSGDRFLVGYPSSGGVTDTASETPDESIDVHFILNLSSGGVGRR